MKRIGPSWHLHIHFLWPFSIYKSSRNRSVFITVSSCCWTREMLRVAYKISLRACSQAEIYVMVRAIFDLSLRVISNCTGSIDDSSSAWVTSEKHDFALGMSTIQCMPKNVQCTPNLAVIRWLRTIGSVRLHSQQQDTENVCWKYNQRIGVDKPVHMRPLPMNPLLQAHDRLPGVFVQMAFVSQPPLLIRHSFISKITTDHE
jgi:hypothetical protein